MPFRLPLGLALFAVTVSQSPVYTQPPPATFGSTPSCARCSIAIEPHAVLQLPGDSLSFDFAAHLIRLSNGGFVATDLTETPIPALFDSTGRFVRLVARRGQGPGELDRHNMDPIAIGPGDSVWVMSSRRLHVFTPEMYYARLDPRVSGEDLLFPSADGSRLVVAWRGMGVRSRFPLHIVDLGGNIVKSFGLDRPLDDPQRVRSGEVSVQRVLVRAADNSFWAYDPHTFLLERYDFDGNLLARGRHELDGWYRDAKDAWRAAGVDRNPGIAALQTSRQPGLIWLVYGHPNADYASSRGGGLVVSRIARGHDVVIEAFDTRTMRVLATRRIPGTFAIRLDNAPDMIAVVQSIDDVFHTFRINRLTLLRPPR